MNIILKAAFYHYFFAKKIPLCLVYFFRVW